MLMVTEHLELEMYSTMIRGIEVENGRNKQQGISQNVSCTFCCYMTASTWVHGAVNTVRLQFPKNGGGMKMPLPMMDPKAWKGMEAVDEELQGMSEAVDGGDCPRRSKTQEGSSI